MPGSASLAAVIASRRPGLRPVSWKYSLNGEAVNFVPEQGLFSFKIPKQELDSVTHLSRRVSAAAARPCGCIGTGESVSSAFKHCGGQDLK